MEKKNPIIVAYYVHCKTQGYISFRKFLKEIISDANIMIDKLDEVSTKEDINPSPDVK
jgi:hypothetical protein